MEDREQLERWLLSEEAGQDDAADAEFAHLFAAVPKVEAGADFVQRTVAEVWRLRARRRRLVAMTWAATLILVTAGAVTAYVASPRIVTAAIKALAFASSRSVPWLVAYTTVAMDWWWTVARVGGVVASDLITPARVIAVVGVELFGILAFVVLQRIVSSERFGDAQV